MIAFIDKYLDRTTMYRVVLYYLIVLLAAAFVLGFFKVVRHDPTALAFSALLITATCWVTNWAFAKAFKAVTNVESVYITALILILILDPVTASDLHGVGVLIFASVWAMASKYIFAIGRKHIFNPAAFGVALPGLLLGQPATWWVGSNIVLLPIVIVGGLLLTRKLQRFDMITAFIVANIGAMLVTTPLDQAQMVLTFTLENSPFFFFLFVMVTEPLTAPQGKWQRIVFGGLVGLLSSSNTHVMGYYFTPEVALLVGNVFAYLVSPKHRFMLTLERIERAGAGAYDFIFNTDRRLAFAPGQYLEWTLPVRHPDDRGNRRYFTVASAPTEDQVRLGVRFYKQASTFKRSLAAMKPGDRISASHLAGDFTLPSNPRTKLVFIAGGIGVTPFRSMLQYLIDEGERRDVVMFYANARVRDIAYMDVLEQARDELGIPTVYTVSDEETSEPGIVNGFITEELIARSVPDYRERVFLLSGSHTMVAHFTQMLRDMGVPRHHIQTDFFPGLA